MTTAIMKGLECTNDAQGNCSPPADRHPASPRAAIPCPHFPVPILNGMSHGMEYTVGHFGSGALAVSCANFLCPPAFLLAGHEKLKNP